MTRGGLLLAAWLALASAARAERGVVLADLAWPEAERLLTPERVVVLPLGAATKEHGPHLRLDNDARLAEHLAGRLLAARPIVLLPTLTYGFYPAFLDYPGSVSLPFETQRDVVVAIARSLARHGPRRFYVLNTGLSTLRPLRAAAELLAAEGLRLAFTDLETAGRETRLALTTQTEGTHADEIETSLMLHVAPERVDMSRAVRDGLPGRPGPLTRDARRADAHVSPSGVYGDATRATSTKGARLVEAIVADLLRDVDALARAPLPAGQPASPLGDEPTPTPRPTPAP